jgi:replicative DNA helicase
MEKQVFQLLTNRQGRELTPIADIVMDAIDRISAASSLNSSITGLATGFHDLDFKTSGFQPSDLILIAARPSMGKPAFALNIGAYMAFRENRRVAIFSLEMSKEQLVNRLLAQESNIDASRLRNGRLKDSEWERLVLGADVIGKSNLVIDDTPGISVAEMRSKCRRLKLEGGLDCILVDYLQLMGSSGRGNDSRQQEISEISRGLKEVAREMHVPVIALSQLSRAVETRPDHRPVLSDLRESGAIEQDADVVIFLYRDDYYNKDSERQGIADIMIRKQRNGPLGDVELVWLPEYTKFANPANERDQARSQSG